MCHVSLYFKLSLCSNKLSIWNSDISSCYWNQVHELPAPIHHDDFVPTSDPDDKMTIAWRYQNMKVVQSSMSSTSVGHHYDLMKSIDAELLKAADICYWTGSIGSVQTKGKISPG